MAAKPLLSESDQAPDPVPMRNHSLNGLTDSLSVAWLIWLWREWSAMIEAVPSALPISKLR